MNRRSAASNYGEEPPYLDRETSSFLSSEPESPTAASRHNGGATMRLLHSGGDDHDEDITGGSPGASPSRYASQYSE
jgi:hypothetical protein